MIEGSRMSQAIWKVMLRPQGDRNYHYAATKHSRQAPRRGEAISLRDIDDKLVKAVIEYVRDEPNTRPPQLAVDSAQHFCYPSARVRTASELQGGEA